MQPEHLSSSHSGNASADRATAALLTSGGVDGVSAHVLRHWQPGTDPPEPVFVTWLLNVGRFCLTVRYGRFSLSVNDGLEMSRFYVVVQRFRQVKWKAIWSVGVVVAGLLRRRVELLVRRE